MRRAAKRDLNEADIVAALVKVGAEVVRLNDPDVADLIVNFRGKLYLIEVKSKRGKLRPGQVEFSQRFPVEIARTVEMALEAIGAM